MDKEYGKITKLLEEFRDIFRDDLEDTDRLSSGELDLKLKPGAEPYLTNRV